MSNPIKPGTLSITQILLIIFFLAILSVAAIFFYPERSAKITIKNPPTLVPASSTLQGSIQSGDGFLGFNEQDVTNFSPPNNLSSIPLKKGVHYYYSDKSTNLQDIIDNIQPVEGNKILFADFNPIQNKFFVYPEGPYVNTEKVNHPGSYYIPANHGFILIAKEATTVWGIKGEDQPVTNSFNDNPFTDGTYSWLNNSQMEGWVLIPTANNFASFLNNAALSKVVAAVYTVGNDGNMPTFTEREPLQSYPGGYYFSPEQGSYMAWIYINPEYKSTNSASCTGCPLCSQTATGVNCSGIGFYSGYNCQTVSGSPVCPNIGSQIKTAGFSGCTGCTGCTGCGGCYIYNNQLICNGPGLGFTGNTTCGTVSNYRNGYRATLCPNGSFVNYTSL